LIYPTIDAGTHTFGVEVTINNSNMRVRPGMYSRVTLNFGTGESIVVPDVAVQKQAGANDKYIYVIEDGVAKYSKVELGQRLGENYEIVSGIKEGDVVVTAGQVRLIDGSPVEIIKE
jgi:RND family efflux transporter MFP subunit